MAGRFEGYEDLPLPGTVIYPSRRGYARKRRGPTGRSSRSRHGEIVGYAGLMEHGNGEGKRRARPHRRAPRSPTARDRRALKLAQLHWAANAGVVELVTWTQRGNEGDASVEREPRLREPLARADDAGAAAVIDDPAGRERGGHRHLRRSAHPHPSGDPDAARGRRRGPEAAGHLDLLAVSRRGGGRRGVGCEVRRRSRRRVRLRDACAWSPSTAGTASGRRCTCVHRSTRAASASRASTRSSATTTRTRSATTARAGSRRSGGCRTSCSTSSTAVTERRCQRGSRSSRRRPSTTAVRMRSRSRPTPTSRPRRRS